MTETDLNYALAGAMVTASTAAGLFFMRFWRDTRDRLFLAFAVAFLLLALNWLALIFVQVNNEGRSWLYIMRLLAFVVIILGIWDKNSRRPNAA